MVDDDSDLTEESYSVTTNEDSSKSMDELETSLPSELEEDD